MTKTTDFQGDIAQDARFLAQERILDALLRALAIRDPELLDTVRRILIDTEFTHSGKPDGDETVHQQIGNRLALASDFASDHGMVAPDETGHHPPSDAEQAMQGNARSRDRQGKASDRMRRKIARDSALPRPLQD